MTFLHNSAKFLLNVSIGFYDMIIFITVRVSIWIESQINTCIDSGLFTVRVACRKIDITLKCDFVDISKIDNIFKTSECFYTKFGQYIAKSHM